MLAIRKVTFLVVEYELGFRIRCESGYRAVCKTAYMGSNPIRISYNMKKTASIIFSLLILAGLFTPKVKAQEFSAAKAYEDYQFELTTFQNSYDEYQKAVGFYKKNPTLQLQEEARQKTLTMLRQRDQLLSTYLTALRMQVLETTGFKDDEKAAIYGKIDPEVAWYKTHKDSYTNGDELATLFGRSDEVKSRYQTLTKFIVYESLFDISLSQELGLRLDHQAVYSDLKNYINDQVANGTLTIDPFNRWLSAIDGVLQTLTQNETLARKKIQLLYTQS